MRRHCCAWFSNLKNSISIKLSMRKHAGDMWHELASSDKFSNCKITGFYEEGISPSTYVNFVNKQLPSEIREILDGKEAIHGLHALANSICKSIFVCFRFASRNDRFLLESCFSNSMRMISDTIAGLTPPDNSSNRFRLMNIPNSFYSENAISMFSHRTFYKLFAKNGILPSPSFVYFVLDDRKNWDTSQTKYDEEAENNLRKFFRENFQSIVALLKADDVQKVHLLKEDEDFIEQFKEEFGINQCKEESEDKVIKISDNMINSLYHDAIFSDILPDARAQGFLLGLPAFDQRKLLIEDKRALEFLPYLDKIYQNAEPISTKNEEPSIWQRCREEFIDMISSLIEHTKDWEHENIHKFELIKKNAPTLVADLSRKYLYLMELGDSRGDILDIIICFSLMKAFTEDELFRILKKHPTLELSLYDTPYSHDFNIRTINKMNTSILQQCLANGCIEKHYMDFSRHKAEAKNLGLSEDELRELCNSVPIYVIDLPKYSEFVGNSFIEGINLRRRSGFFCSHCIRDNDGLGPVIYMRKGPVAEMFNNLNSILRNIGSDDTFSFPQFVEHHEVAHSITNARGYKRMQAQEDGPGNLSYLLSPQEAIAIVHGEIPYIVSLLKDCLLSAMSSDAVQAALRRWYVSKSSNPRMHKHPDS